MHDHLLDKSREKTVLDASGKTEAAHLADFIRSKLDNECEVEARSFIIRPAARLHHCRRASTPHARLYARRWIRKGKGLPMKAQVCDQHQ